MGSANADDFSGTERFSIERRLGAGGFGVVYRAYDRKRASVVALKALRRAESDALYRFKQEFRALADITHPNLVTLYELLADGDQWFFTMELVEGSNFLEHVRGLRPRESSESDEVTNSPAATPSDSTPQGGIGVAAARALLHAGLEAGAEVGGAVFVEERLRASLRQLAVGLHALHAAGKLHRDIKPSNVLVTGEGRVLLLDFGLVSDLGPEGFLHSVHLVGTPAYMSPEQAAGRPVTEASDWYGVGVMLYEALTGARPFPGEYLDVLVEKQTAEPPAPRELAPSAPEDLDALCRALLARDAQERPTGAEILRRLDAAGPASVPASAAGRETASGAARPAPFVGRERELAELASAFARAREGRAVAVLVRGSSGVGKTALVRRFLEGLRKNENGAVVLTGRCYEQETVPYKALDSLVDALSRFLQRLPPAEAEALLPRDLLALVRLFPVLRQVEAVAHARRRTVAIPDSLEVRRRGFGALRELLARLAERSPLVLSVDDLQWGDADSASLLIELMRPPDPPPVLWVGCYRTEDVGRSPMLDALLSFRPGAEGGLETIELEVSELSPGEANDLARALLEGASAPTGVTAESIASESRGNPFLLDELARHVRSGEPLRKRGAASLEDVIRARVTRLPEGARQLLDVLAVAGRPVSRSIARRAAAIEGDDQAALAVLRTGHLVRGSSVDGGEQVEIYHDRIGETVRSLIPEATLGVIHERLALSLEMSREADPESLALHYERAGSRARAAVYAADAAGKAAEALAFDRAARLYELALRLGALEASTRRDLRIKLGDALANAGRGAEAARAYLAAAEGPTAAETVELQRRAAEQLLRSGHVDEGLAVLRQVLERIGMRLPATPRGALLSFLVQRFQLRLRGYSFRERPPTEIPADELIRIDACWSVSTGLSLIDTIRGRDFQARHMLLALRAGELTRITRAMANEAGYTSTAGWPARHWTKRLVDRAMALAAEVGHPHVIGMTFLNASIAAYLEGRFESGWELFEKCEQIFREECTGVAWELDTAHVVAFRSLTFLGRLGELAKRLPGLLREARERDDRFATASLQMRYGYLVRLMSDEPDRASHRLTVAARSWSHAGFHLQHYFHLFAQTEIFLYEDSGAAAWQGLANAWKMLEASLLRRRVQLFRIESQHLRARAALSAAAAARGPAESRRDRLVDEAAGDARRIAREDAPWAEPLANLVRAGVSSLRSEPSRARDLLAAAEAGFEASKMALYAAAARRSRGLLVGGEEGRALVETADAWMRGERIKNPGRMAAMLAPGRWESG